MSTLIERLGITFARKYRGHLSSQHLWIIIAAREVDEGEVYRQASRATAEMIQPLLRNGQRYLEIESYMLDSVFARSYLNSACLDPRDAAGGRCAL